MSCGKKPSALGAGDQKEVIHFFRTGDDDGLGCDNISIIGGQIEAWYTTAFYAGPSTKKCMFFTKVHGRQKDNKSQEPAIIFDGTNSMYVTNCMLGHPTDGVNFIEVNNDSGEFSIDNVFTGNWINGNIVVSGTNVQRCRFVGNYIDANGMDYGVKFDTSS